jgi:hypothetical protein
MVSSKPFGRMNVVSNEPGIAEFDSVNSTKGSLVNEVTLGHERLKCLLGGQLR